MRRTLIIDPIKKTLITEDPDRAGLRFLDSESKPYDLFLVSQGSSLTVTQPLLSVRVQGDVVGGSKRKQINEIATGGLTPLAFSDPFRFHYSFADTTNPTNLVGQASYGTKHYRTITFNPPNQKGGAGSQTIENASLVEFNGDLYMVCEQTLSTGGEPTRCVYLLKYQPNQSVEDSFIVVKVFDEIPVQTTFTTQTIQQGSPHAIVHNQNLYIAYRAVEEGRASRIIVFRGDSTLRFVPASQIELSESPEYDKYRLRIATSKDTIMLVSYGTKTIERLDEDGLPLSPPVFYGVRDFRTYISFDDGSTFKNRSEAISPVVKTTIQVEQKRTDSNVSSFFFPDFTALTNETDYSKLNPKFDLYFDDKIGMFVILKGGDPYFKPLQPSGSTITNAKAGNHFLMAIGASVDDPFTWTPLMKHPLNASNCSITDPFKNLTDDPTPLTSPQPSNDLEYAYFIEDVRVVANDDANLLLLSFRSSHPEDYRDFSHATTVFRFFEDRYVRSGFSNQVLARGGKSHPSISYAIDIINSSQSALFHSGDYNREVTSQNILHFLNIDDIAATKYRSQIVATAKISGFPVGVSAPQGIDTSSIYPFLCFIRPLTNAGDEDNYEFCFPRCFEDHTYMMPYTEVGTPPTKTYGNRQMERLLLSPATTTAFWRLPDSIDPSNGITSLLTRLKRGVDLIDFPVFKLRFQMGYANLPIDFTFARARIEGHLDLDFLIDDFTGLIMVDDQSSIQSFPSFVTNPNTVYDMMFVLGFNSLGQQGWTLNAFVKEIDAPYTSWVKAGRLDVQRSSPVSTAVQLGYITSTPAPASNTYIEIGDIHFSSCNLFYPPIYKTSNSQIDFNQPSFEPSTNPSNHPQATSYRTFTARNPLHDGTVVQFNSSANKTQTDLFQLKLAKPFNSVTNIENFTSEVPFNFLPFYDNVDGFEVIFRLENKEDFDSLSYAHLFGPHEVVIRAGDYDETTDTWIVFDEETMNIPYLEIPLEEYYDNFIIAKEDLATYQLQNYFAYIYDGTNAIRQVKINTNYDNIIEIDQDLGPLVFADVPRLVVYLPAASFDIPAVLGQQSYSHLSLRFFAPSGSTRQAFILGRIFLGEAFEVSNFTTSLPYTDSTVFTLLQSDRGYNFQNPAKPTLIKSEMTLNIESLQKTQDDYIQLKELLKNLKKNNAIFPVVQQETDGNATYHGTITSLTIPRSGREENVTSTMALHNWSAKIPSLESEPLTINILADNTNVQVGSTVTFTAQILNPAPNTTYEYEWNFGNNTASFNPSDFAIYSTRGVFIVTLVVAGTDGSQATQRLEVNVREEDIAFYDASIDNTASPKLITVQARNAANTATPPNNTEVVQVEVLTTTNELRAFNIQAGFAGAYSQTIFGRLYFGFLFLQINNSTLDTGSLDFRITDSEGRVFDLNVTVT
jgi:hypothetical protein